MNATPEPANDGRDPADLERDAEKIRADMDRTLDALERKFSPGQLLDRSLGYLREHGADIAENLGTTVRQNPLPVLMTAAGLLWMVTSTYRAGSRRNERHMRYPGIVPEKGLGDKLKRRAAAAGERVRSTRQSAVNQARSTTHAAADTVSSAVHATRAQTQRARDRFQVMMDEQPIVVGAIGLAVGAIIGAALPTTPWENRMLGQARDRAIAKAREVGERQYEELRETIRGAGEEATPADTQPPSNGSSKSAASASGSSQAAGRA